MKVEVFFDYTCPYCLKGHEILMELLPEYPELEIVWRPCEAHPRPENYSPHSDLCVRGMLYAKEIGVEILDYHKKVYEAIFEKRENIENPQILAEVVAELINPEAFLGMLNEGKYEKELYENNKLAWETYAFPAVPSFYMNGEKLTAVPNVGLTKEAMKTFIEKNRQ